MSTRQLLARLADAGYRVRYHQLESMLMAEHVARPAIQANRRVWTDDNLRAILAYLQASRPDLRSAHHELANAG